MNPIGLVHSIAFATSRNMTVGAARRFAASGVNADDYYTLEASQLSALTGVNPERFSEKRRKAELSAASAEAEFLENSGVRAVFCWNEDYPERLAMCDDAPAVLFVLGKMPHYRHVLSIVGTRHCTAYGKAFTERFVADVAAMYDDVLIVSGLALGIDICAHRAAMNSGLPTAAVLAHGLNTIYPHEHRSDARRIVTDGGFLATEYRSSDIIHRGNFLARNRIVAGLSDATIVVESDLRGGAMATARIAGAYNRELMAVPGRTTDQYSRGCNALIAREQAHILRDASDLEGLMNWEPVAAEGTQRTLDFDIPDKFSSVTALLRERPDMTADEMAIALAMPINRLNDILFEMEMSDLGTTVPGGRFVLTI